MAIPIIYGRSVAQDVYVRARVRELLDCDGKVGKNLRVGLL